MATLRPYQQRLVDASIEYMLRNVSPFCVEAATGAGKSHCIAAVADAIHQHTGKRILCLAPSAELVNQNKEKFLATGNPASTFSASAGAKELRHPVVFGSPLTVKNKISRFQRPGADGYALVILDECHGITPTIKSIIEAMRHGNPNLRVMGLTATPYRLGSGYIYQEEPDGFIWGEDKAREPYFAKCVERVGARELIAQGYLTPPVIGQIGAEGYDTAGLTLNSRGQFDASAIDKAYHGHGRKTAAVVADVVAQSQGRRGVMFFAATVKHAQEVLASLPPELSAIVTGETPAKERRNILARFKTQQIKYIVNVSVLTVGFDCTHVDVIAILRKTESVGLLQQIIGRGLRIHPGKVDCLVLDYTTNLEDHCPDGDLFAPVVRAGKAAGVPGGVRATCPECAYQNDFSIRPEVKEAGYEIDEHGYCVDLEGLPIETESGPLPAHFGRRCWGMLPSRIERGKYERCGYRWTGKQCPECSEQNDIAARYCIKCKAEIVDPNEKLAVAFKALKRDPTLKQTDEVLDMSIEESISQKGNPTLRVNFVTPYRSFTVWYQTQARHVKGQAEYEVFMESLKSETGIKTVTYRKDPASGFYKALGYNQRADVPPETRASKKQEELS
jgi:DNA repair protein RadD